MISKKTLKLLNEQVALESDSSNIYLSMGTWADANGWRGTAKFMYKQAEEERGHMKKFIAFITDVGDQAVVTGMKDPEVSFKDIKEVFKATLGHERKITAAIHNIMSEARKNNDYAVTSFIKWFIDEQVEEEKTAMDILDVIEKAGQVSMYLADKEIGAYAA
ncbi:MAG: ferritin [Candidatus Omnitrophota bacterium]